jgi:hypothetical protein
MFYQLLVGYFAIRFIGELFLGEEEEETNIRESCRCTMCSGMYILN